MPSPLQPFRRKLMASVIGLVATSLVWSGGTFSAFNKTSEMPDNSVAAASVNLADNDSGSAVMSLTGVRPGDAASSSCVNVTYTGDAPSKVRLYGTVGGTGLAPFLVTTITRGTFSGTPAAGSCTGFTADASALWTGTLDQLPTSAATAITTDTESWTNAEKHGYRVTVSLPSGTDSAAQGKTATFGLTWMAVSE
jgi:hypothetical protein